MYQTPLRCLITIFACTWTAIHPNIPAQDLEDSETVLGPEVSNSKLRKKAKRIANRVQLTLLAIIFPEFFLGQAWADRQAASKSANDFNHATNPWRLEADWTATHAFYANMGGLILKVRKDALTPDQQRSLGDWQQRMSKLRPSWTERSSYAGIVTGGSCFRLKMLVQIHWSWTYATSYFRGQPALDQTGIVDQGKRYIEPVTIWYLNADQIHTLRSSGVLRSWPQVAISLIEDKSDANVVGKLMSMATIGWLVISVFWQLGHGSAITPIEATAMAYAIVAVITYGLWFEKPLDVNTSTEVLDFDHAKLSGDILTDLEEGTEWSYINEQRRHDIRLPVSNDIDWPGSALRYSFWGHSIGISYVDAGFWLGGLLFGFVHIAAFWYAFENSAEKILWLVATMVSLLAIPLISLASLLLKPLRPAEGSVDHERPGAWYNVTLGVHYLCAIFYLMARAFTLFESLRYVLKK